MATSLPSRPLRPFTLTPLALSLSAPYPDPKEFVANLAIANPTELEWIARLWLSEGIPFRFRDHPMMYEAIRGWVAGRLEIDPKEVTLIGSSRIGFSLAPPPSLGRPFSDMSDLDLSIISQSLFHELKSTFETWALDFERQEVTPRGPNEQKYWPENVRLGKRNIPKGFLDPWLIPTLDRYPVVGRIQRTVWALRKKLQLTVGTGELPKASVRLYGSWGSFVKRLAYNTQVAIS